MFGNHFQLFMISEFTLFTVITLVFPQTVQINSTVANGDVLCPGQVISFTCETSGSGSIAWSSSDYIGQGSQILFSIGENVGQVSHSVINPTTFAMLQRSEIVGGIPMLKSQLTLSVSAAFPNPSVTCEHVGNGQNVGRQFQPLGE